MKLTPRKICFRLVIANDFLIDDEFEVSKFEFKEPEDHDEHDHDHDHAPAPTPEVAQEPAPAPAPAPSPTPGIDEETLNEALVDKE